MDNANMAVWDKLKSPPISALKTIAGGRLRGFTDVNPQWRYKAMTEQFGVCGVGWKYTVEKLWLEPAGDQVCAFAEVGLSIKVDGEWSAPIPGIGGSMLVEKETSGLHVSDEAYKMAVTDALSVAMKMIGVAADVYEGFCDGARYTNDEKPPTRKAEQKTSPETKEPPPLKNKGELMARAAKFGLSTRDVCVAVEVGKPEEIIDLDEAWRATVLKYAATIRAASK